MPASAFRPAGVLIRGAVLVAGALVVLAGCGRYAVQREVVVTFERTATQAQHDAARTACSGVPRTSPEPAPSSTAPAALINDVRFRVDKANDAELARLYDCLRRQPGVLGVKLPTVQ